LLDTKSDSVNFLKNLRALFPADMTETQRDLSDFISVIEMIEAVGLPYMIDFTSGKGFEYYTGIIFRLFVAGVNVGGGGRYNKLVEMMGGALVPAAGFALYTDCLAACIDIDSAYVPASQKVSVNIMPDVVKLGNEVSALLRRAGLTVLTALDGKHAYDCGWELEVRSADPQLVLFNCGTGEKNNCSDVMEVVVLVGLG